MRCYSPPDFALLLRGTGLTIDFLEADGVPGLSELDDAEFYLAVLRRLAS